jgi:hypothetical protein
VIDVSDVQNEKQDEPIISTRRGIQIDLKDEEQNASDSIRLNKQSRSNVIDVSDLQNEKQDEPIILTRRGIQIDRNDEQENA